MIVDIKLRALSVLMFFGTHMRVQTSSRKAITRLLNMVFAAVVQIYLVKSSLRTLLTFELVFDPQCSIFSTLDAKQFKVEK